MNFDIPVSPQLPQAVLDAKKAKLASKLSKASIPKAKRQELITDVEDTNKLTDASDRAQHFNPNETITPIIKQEKGISSSPHRQAHIAQTGAMIVHKAANAYKPVIPTRRAALEEHEILKDRDFQSQHEEISHLRSNLPDLERIISIIKAENVRLKAELLLKGKDYDHFKELSQQMKLARDREVQTLAAARQEWGKVVSDRDFSIEKLQKDLNEARQALNSLTDEIRNSQRLVERLKGEHMEEVATHCDEIKQLRHKLQQLERESSARLTLHQDTISNHTEEQQRLKADLQLHKTENNALRLKVVDWDGMVGELADLRNQIHDYKSGYNANESRLRQELGEAAEEIHLLREEKTGLLRLVEKLELQANAALSKLETVSGRNSPAKSPVVANEGPSTTRALTSEEEVASLTASRTRITKELSSFRGGEWSNTLGSIGKLRQHLTEEEVRRREAEDRMEQERGARRRLEREVGEKLRVTERLNEELQIQLSAKDKDIEELHKRQAESSHRFAQLKSNSERDQEELTSTKIQLSQNNDVITELRAKVRSLSQENSNLFGQISSQAAIVSRLQDEAGDFETLRSSLADELRTAQHEKEAIQSSHDRLLKDNVMLSEEVKRSRTLSAEHKSDVLLKEKQLEEAITELSALKSNLSEVKKRSPSTSGSDIEIDAENYSPPNDPEEALPRNTLSKRQQRKVDLIRTKKELNDLQKVSNQLTSQLAEAESDAKKVKELENTVVTLSLEIAKSSAANVKAENELEIERKRFAKTEADLSTSLQKARVDNMSLESQLNDTKNSLFTMQNAIIALEKTHDATILKLNESHTESLKQIENIVSTLEKELSTTKEQHHAQTLEMESLKHFADTQAEALIRSEHALQEAKTEKDQLVHSAQEREAELQSLSNKVNEFEALLGERLKDFAQTQSQLDETAEVLRNTQAQRDELSSRVQELLTNREDLVKKNKEAETTIHSLESQGKEKEIKFAREVEDLKKRLQATSLALDEAKNDRFAERQKFTEQQDFDKKALMARVKQSTAKCKELETALGNRSEQLRVEFEKNKKLSDLIRQETSALKAKSENDLEQMRDSYERAMTKLREQIDGAHVIEDLRKKLAKAEKELKDIKQVQLHW